MVYIVETVRAVPLQNTGFLQLIVVVKTGIMKQIQNVQNVTIDVEPVNIMLYNVSDAKMDFI